MMPPQIELGIWRSGNLLNFIKVLHTICEQCVQFGRAYYPAERDQIHKAIEIIMYHTALHRTSNGNKE